MAALSDDVSSLTHHVSSLTVSPQVIISYLINATQLRTESPIPLIAFVLSWLLLITHAILLVRYTSMVLAFDLYAKLRSSEDDKKRGGTGRHGTTRRLREQAWRLCTKVAISF